MTDTKHTPGPWVNVWTAHKNAFIQKFTAHESYERGETTIWPELALTYDTQEAAESAIKDDVYYAGFQAMPLSTVRAHNAAVAKSEGGAK